MGLLVFTGGGGVFRTQFPPFTFPDGTLPRGIQMAPWAWLDGGSGAGRATAEKEYPISMAFFLCSNVANTSCTLFQL